MIELAAYYDVAGHSSDQPFVVVAGFVANEKQWLDFERKWPNRLAKLGLGTVLHTTDFMSDRARTTNEKRAALLQLAMLARTSTSASFAIGVDMEAYHELNEEYGYEEFVGTPHAIAARTFSKKVREWMEPIKKTHKLVILHEKGGEHIGDMRSAFERDGLPEPHPVEKELPPVQAADLLAWLFAYQLRNRGPIEALEEIRKGQRMFGGLYTQKDLLDLGRAHKVKTRKELGSYPFIAFETTPKRRRVRTIHPRQ